MLSFSDVFVCLQQQTETRIQMIKMVNEFKLCTPKPDADLCMRVDLPLDRKTMENEEWATGPPGLRTAGPPGRRAVAGRGPRAAGPSGRRAAGPWRAVGRGALGLLLAKPYSHVNYSFYFSSVQKPKFDLTCVNLLISFYSVPD